MAVTQWEQTEPVGQQLQMGAGTAAPKAGASAPLRSVKCPLMAKELHRPARGPAHAPLLGVSGWAVLTVEQEPEQGRAFGHPDARTVKVRLTPASVFVISENK